MRVKTTPVTETSGNLSSPVVCELKFPLISATNVGFSSYPALVTSPPPPGKVVGRKAKRGHFDTEGGQTSHGSALEGVIKMISPRAVMMAHSFHLRKDVQREDGTERLQAIALGGKIF